MEAVCVLLEQNSKAVKAELPHLVHLPVHVPPSPHQKKQNLEAIEAELAAEAEAAVAKEAARKVASAAKKSAAAEDKERAKASFLLFFVVFFWGGG